MGGEGLGGGRRDIRRGISLGGGGGGGVYEEDFVLFCFVLFCFVEGGGEGCDAERRQMREIKTLR